MSKPQQGEQIHARTLALLVNVDQLRRLRWRYAHDPEVSADLWRVTEALLNWHAGGTDSTEMAPSVPPVSPSELTVAQAAAIAGVKPNAIYRAIGENRIHATERHGRYFIERAEAARYASRRAWGGRNQAHRG
ncbi:helix-turn-helix domain-containing protein [Nonomuraea sp. NPDC050153]|uniref:helix-turn-helix domain-containing protein n=1 Tax=Nonomuraea sp. NPDC050153 TaxID=3364359 RepID=UPI003794A64F